MKNLIFILTILASATSVAQDITVLINGSPGGTFFVRSEMYVRGLEQRGYNVTVVNAKKSNAAAEKFNNTTEPTLMVWIDALAPVRPVEATVDNFVASEYSAPLYLCAVSDKTAGTIGAPKMYVMDPVLDMVPNSTIIPYKNTGATLNAALAGEVDFAYLNQGKAKKLVDVGYPCRSVPGVAQRAFVIAKNINKEKLRIDVISIQEGAEFKEWLDKNQFNTAVRSRVDVELDAVIESQEQWKSAVN